MSRLTLKDALKAGNLKAFITQAEAEGVAPADAERVYASLEALIKQQPEADQTSPAPFRDGSAGKKTR